MAAEGVFAATVGWQWLFGQDASLWRPTGPAQPVPFFQVEDEAKTWRLGKRV